ncbi:DUF166 domain-containing protein [Candidatus Bathyarchaeota archaeon]|nr:DUF166 domain-containing protein [Candidatus Bathyarchaeota archaeon]
MQKMHICFIYQDPFAERVIGNLCNADNFCRACSLLCERCRLKYGSFAGDIQYVHRISANLPAFIEEPRIFLPENMPECDVLIAVALHPDILLAIPQAAQESNAKAVIVPIEDKRWCPPGVRQQMKKKLDETGIEYAFPKPFCSLEPFNQPVIENLVKRYAIGKPEVEVEVRGGFIANANVVRSAPCGSTWYVAQQIRGKKISEIEEAVAVAHHSYPCTASMEVDPEIGDTILHKAGYIIREAVKNAISRASS